MGSNDRSTGRIRSGGAKARLSSPFFPGGPQETGRIIDVSVKGMGFQFPFPLATDQEVGIELYHPILTENVQLKARVAWCRMVPGDTQPNAGVEFVQTTDRQRLILRLIQASELSCRVISGDRTVGFVVTPSDDHWALYDHQTMKVATMTRHSGIYQVTFYGTRPEDSVHSFDADTLPEAVAMAFSLQGTPLIVPPEGGNWIPVPILDTPVRPGRPKREIKPVTAVHKVIRLEAEETEKPQERTHLGAQPEGQGRSSQAFHSVLASGYHVGFVAVTSVDDVWSLYDEGWNEVALMSPHEGRWKVVFVGGSSAPRGSSESLDYLIAKSFLGGLSLAFDLKVVPELDPPLAAALEPTSTGHGSTGHDIDVAASGVRAAALASPPPESAVVEDEEAPLSQGRAHHCILDGSDLVGYAAPTLGAEGFWSVYNQMRERVAMVAPDGKRFKIMFIGSNPDDSLDYMVAKSLKGAFALTFDLETMPRLDPPLDPPGRT